MSYPWTKFIREISRARRYCYRIMRRYTAPPNNIYVCDKWLEDLVETYYDLIEYAKSSHQWLYEQVREARARAPPA